MTKTLQAATNDVFHGVTTLETAINDLINSGITLTMHWDRESGDAGAWEVCWAVDESHRYRALHASLRMALCGAMNRRFNELMAALVASGDMNNE